MDDFGETIVESVLAEFEVDAWSEPFDSFEQANQLIQAYKVIVKAN